MTPDLTASGTETPTAESGWADDLVLGLALAEASDAITIARFMATDLVIESKPDLTPVTDADQAVETAIRELIAAERPGDIVVGEEYGGGDVAADRRWIVDPIDGTKNFVRGVPIWATLIGLEVGGEMVLGVVSAPAMGRRWWGGRGLGAWTKTVAHGVRPCQVSKVSHLKDAFVSYSSRNNWGDGFDELLGSVWRTRAYGDFFSHMLIAEGAVDIACEPEVSLWDMAALQPIVEAAGGRFSDLSGRPEPGSGNVLCTNGILHDEVLGMLQR